MKRIKFLFLLLVFPALLFPLPASAHPLLDGKVIMGGSYTLQTGETLDGDLVIMGGTVTIEENATITGDVALFGGTLDISGLVQGDVAAFGGVVTLNANAQINGDFVSAGGVLNRDPQAIINGEVVTTDNAPSFNFDLPLPSPLGGNIHLRQASFATSLVKLFFETLWFFFQVFMLSALAVLALMFLENPVERIAHAAITQPAFSGGVGLLTIIVLPLLLVVLGITIILLPVTLLGFLALIGLGLYGWIALGYETGQRLAVALQQSWAPPVAAGTGTFMLTLIAGGIGKIIPCVGWLVPLVVTGFGLGAVILTQLGTQDYPPGGAFIPGKASPSQAGEVPHLPAGDASPKA
ncbi:MAG: hypothetical protein Fur0018_04930 [Anaerolineales bacterium]